MNALLQHDWNWKFWTALNVVLLLRVAIDVVSAWREAEDSGS